MRAHAPAHQGRRSERIQIKTMQAHSNSLPQKLEMRREANASDDSMGQRGSTRRKRSTGPIRIGPTSASPPRHNLEFRRIVR
jgi:hypothetical protein